MLMLWIRAEREAVARRDLARFNAMSDEEQAAERAKHADSGDELNSHKQHYFQERRHCHTTG